MKAVVFIHEDTPDRNGNQLDIEGLSFPESVPVRMEFNGPEIGKAFLKREGNKIMADICSFAVLGKKLYPAIGFRVLKCSIGKTIPIIKKAEINEVSICSNNADPRIPPLGTLAWDWTVNPETGRSNSSEIFNKLCLEVERLIRESAHDIVSGRANNVARLIMAQLAHKHGMEPGPESAD